MAKKPKVKIKREKTSFGWAYRIYIDGMYMGAALSRDVAVKSVERMLAIHARMSAFAVAIGGKADIGYCSAHVGFRPKADVAR